MSEAERDPTSMSSTGTDQAVSDGEEPTLGQPQEETLEEALGEALDEVLGEAAAQVVEEAMTEAQNPRRRKKRTSKGKRGSGSLLERVDGTMALVLFANLMFMGLILFLPASATPKEDVDPPRISTLPDFPSKPDSSPSSASPQPLESRVLQLAEIEGLVRLGRFEEAIAKIEGTMRDHPDLPPMVRRSLYSRLANYSAEAGNHDKALRYLKLSSSGFQMSLLPKDLWKMAQDASQLGDQPGSRKYLARFLLQESLMDGEMESKIPSAYLRLGDGYRIQATEAEKAGGKK